MRQSSDNLGKTWQLGPFKLVGNNWPVEWSEYASTNYHRATASAASLTVEVVDIASSAYGPQLVEVRELDVTRTGLNEYLVRAADAFEARYDYEASRIELRVSALVDFPHIVLGNPLRGALSVALPVGFDGLMFHASSGILDGQGALFPGISTAGKTTLALGFDKVTYLSDDITLTKNLVASPTLSASPFFGIAGRKGANAEAPLRAVGVLVRKNPDKTVITRLSKKDALRELMRHVICWSNDAGLHTAILSNLHSLVQQVPVFAVERYLGDSSDVVMEQVLSAAINR